MQIFLPYASPYLTAKILDKRRLHKQIIECKQIIKAICGVSNAWKNHPICTMYKNDIEWLIYYTSCLDFFNKGYLSYAKLMSEIAKDVQLKFINEAYCDNFKKRLYCKDKNKYGCFKTYGESYENWYYIDNNWKIYKQK